MRAAERSSEGELARSTRAYRRVIGAIHLLGATAYTVPWLHRLRPSWSAAATSGLVLVLAVAFAAWTARSRRPTVVSVLGAFLVAAVISLGPTIVAAGRLDPLVLLTLNTQLTFALAFSLGVVLARPAAWGRAYGVRPSLAAADRSAARAGVWLVLVATPPLAMAAYAFRAAPRDPEALFGLVVAGAIVFFAIVVAVSGAMNARSRKDWLAQVRRGEVPGYRLRPRVPTDPVLVAFDDVASVRSSAVLEACAKVALFAHAETGRPVALAPLS